MTPTSLNFDEVFWKFWNTWHTYTKKIWNYIPSSHGEYGPWRREQTVELMQCFDSRTTYSKFESETSTVWLFLSSYVSASIFLWLYYINKYISFKSLVFSLGSLLIYGQKLLYMCVADCNKRFSLSISRNTNDCWGFSCPASKVFTSTKSYWF